MLVHVRAKTHGAAVQVHLLGQPAFHQRVEAVVNRRHGDVRHAFLGAQEDLFSGRVVALLDQHVINMLALGRESKSARRQTLVDAMHFLLDRRHSVGNVYRWLVLSILRIILNLN